MDYGSAVGLSGELSGNIKILISVGYVPGITGEVLTVVLMHRRWMRMN